jgi:hypothetical protein
MIFCSACRCGHRFEVGHWAFDGNYDAPTFSPEMLIRTGHRPARHFPVLSASLRAILGSWSKGPIQVPWDFLLPHEHRAMRNHDGQDLALLARRGGLSYSEMLAIVEDRPWREVKDAAATIDRLVAAWLADRPATVCRSSVKSGMIEYASDCTHAMAGVTVALEPF